jgi:hypothetical protein
MPPASERIDCYPKTCFKEKKQSALASENTDRIMRHWVAVFPQLDVDYNATKTALSIVLSRSNNLDASNLPGGACFSFWKNGGSAIKRDLELTPPVCMHGQFLVNVVTDLLRFVIRNKIFGGFRLKKYVPILLLALILNISV